jgi:uncharacterized membrane protein
MASTVSNSIEIARPLRDVFEFVDDYKNVTRYLVGMVEWRPVGTQVTGKGSRFAMTKRVDGPVPDLKSELEITDWQQDELIKFQSYSGFENSGFYRFTATAGGTRVTLSNTYDLSSLLGGNRGGFFGSIAKSVGGAVSKAAEGQILRDLEKSLQKLRDLVEREVQVAPASSTKSPAAPVKAASARKPAAPPKRAAAPATKAAAPAKKAAAPAQKAVAPAKKAAAPAKKAAAPAKKAAAPAKKASAPAKKAAAPAKKAAAPAKKAAAPAKKAAPPTAKASAAKPAGAAKGTPKR